MMNVSALARRPIASRSIAVSLITDGSGKHRIVGLGRFPPRLLNTHKKAPRHTRGFE